MKYVSIDIETTGLDREKCQVLSIGVVLEDTNNQLPLDELPRFHCAIVGRSSLVGETFALNLNRELISKIVEYETAEDKESVEKKYNMIFRKEDEICTELFRFMYRNNFLDMQTHGGHVYIKNGVSYPANPPVSHITVAGKNFATFDKIFLEKLPRWKQYFKIRQRIIDPTLLFTNWFEDEALVNLSTCKERAGLKETSVSHNADEDALDIIKLLRTKY